MSSLLLVDDESMVRIGVKTCVDWDSLGVTEVLEASNGAEALEIVKKKCVDVIITDLKMAVMDGFSMIEQLLNREYQPQIIVMSCYNDYDNMRLAMKYGVKDFLFKPKMQPEDIEEAVRKVMVSVEKQTSLMKSKEEDEQLKYLYGEGFSEELVQALRFIEQHLTDPELSLGLVAENAGLSVSYLSRLFKSRMECSYSNYIIKKRIELADELYRSTDLKVYEIAEKVGYTNIRYFSKLYKEQTGKSMRNRVRKQP